MVESDERGGGAGQGVPFVAELAADGSGLLARPLLDPARAGVPVAPPTGDLAAGDVVVVAPAGMAAVVRGGCLARAGSARADVYRVAAAAGLDPLHPPAAMREARALRRDPGVSDPALEDLTRLPFVTVDGKGARDLDQAVHVERSAGGAGYLVRYALADASHYVRPRSALFSSALERGASVYLPGLVVPMLPRLLCEDLVSLNQGVDRRALVLTMRLDPSGACVETRLGRARVRSARKLSFERVERHYDDPAGSGFGSAPWRETVDLLAEVGRLRLARQRHALQLRRFEVEVSLEDGSSASFVAVGAQRLEVERYNEQLSLLANVEGARWLAAAGPEEVQAIFRVHPAPGEAELAAFERSVAELVAGLGLDPERWLWRRPDETLADYLGRLPAAGRPGRLTRALERQALLVNQESRFDAAAAPHHGVGSEVYARFSAPMREIVGVFTHKEAVELLTGDAAAPAAVDEELRRQVIAAGNRARELQRRVSKETNALVLDRLLGADLARPPGSRPTRRATVVGLDERRLHCTLDQPPVDIKVYVADLAERWGCGYSPSPGRAALLPAEPGAPTLWLGDPLDLAVAGLDDRRRRWRFRVEAPRAATARQM